jgi:FMN phosphatase YigB (HAD superfamily)
MTKEIPENIIYIDDKEEYVTPAKKLGMNGIVYKNPEQLGLDLKTLGVNF